MAKAIWNGVIIAESEQTVMVEGNHYFPMDAIQQEYFVESDKRTTCPWKGQASYFTLVVDGQENPDAAWTYRQPKKAAESITNHVAFWRGVTVEA